MIRILRRLQQVSLTWLLILFLIAGCSAIEDDSQSPPSKSKDFNGYWRITEEITGCSMEKTLLYDIEITQQGADVKFKFVNDELSCKVDGDELLCSGEVHWNENIYRVFEEVNIWFEGEDQLEGAATWTVYSNEDNTSCSGDSSFFTNDKLPSDTEDFSGSWNIYEEKQGCNESGSQDYTIDITQNGIDADLYVGSQRLGCKVNGNELHCDGQLEYVNDAYDIFSEYVLWFNNEGKIEGNAAWTHYDESMSECSGTSTIYESDPISDPIDFQDAYSFYLNIDDCVGYRAGEESETYVITQNGTYATFTRQNNEDFGFECRVVDETLQCSGNTFYFSDSTAIWEFSNIAFSYDSRNNLTGIATGIYYEEDGSECPGTYYFSPYSPDTLPTETFSGTWNVVETLQGCQGRISGGDQYTIEIIQNGANATLSMDDQIFNCTVSSDELVCSRRYEFENGTYLNYGEYRLWFNDNNMLEGIARWTRHSTSDETCSGVSTIIDSRAEGDNGSSGEESTMSISRHSRFEALQNRNSYIK